MSIKIEIAGDGYSEKWDELVETSQYGSIFHTWNWLKIIEKHTKTKLYPLVGVINNIPIGIFPLFYKEKNFTKMVFSPPPQTAVSRLGPVMVINKDLKPHKREYLYIEFVKKVDEFINSELKPNYTLISAQPGLLDSRPFIWAGYQVEPIFNYSNDLNKGHEYLWSLLTSNLRRGINKSKNIITIEEGSKHELEVIYDLMVERYKEQNRTVNISKDYLFDIYDSFYPQKMKILVAKYEGEVVTGIIDVQYKDTNSSWIGNPKTNLNIPSPNDLLNWEAFFLASQNGFDYYETIGAAGTERLYSYYSKFNPQLMVSFSARKYSSFIYRWMEIMYSQFFKFIYDKLKIIGKKQ